MRCRLARSGGSAKGFCTAVAGPMGELTEVASAKRAVLGVDTDRRDEEPVDALGRTTIFATFLSLRIPFGGSMLGAIAVLGSWLLRMFDMLLKTNGDILATAGQAKTMIFRAVQEKKNGSERGAVEGRSPSAGEMADKSWRRWVKYRLQEAQNWNKPTRRAGTPEGSTQAPGLKLRTIRAGRERPQRYWMAEYSALCSVKQIEEDG